MTNLQWTQLCLSSNTVLAFIKENLHFCTLQSVPGNQGPSKRNPGSSKNDNKFPVLEKAPFISVVLNHSLPSLLSALSFSALLSHGRLKTACKKQGNQ